MQRAYWNQQAGQQELRNHGQWKGIQRFFCARSNRRYQQPNQATLETQKPGKPPGRQKMVLLCAHNRHHANKKSGLQTRYYGKISELGSKIASDLQLSLTLSFVDCGLVY